MPFGWWGDDHGQPATANSLTSDTLTDWGGGVAYSDTLVEVQRVDGGGQRLVTLRERALERSQEGVIAFESLPRLLPLDEVREQLRDYLREEKMETAVSAKIDELRELQMLYLLTIADLRATGSTMWNEWRATLLRRLYRKVATALEAGGAVRATRDIDAIVGAAGPGLQDPDQDVVDPGLGDRHLLDLELLGLEHDERLHGLGHGWAPSSGGDGRGEQVRWRRRDRPWRRSRP